MQRIELEKLSREELITHATHLGVPRPRVLTQPELMDEIITRTAKTEREKTKARGWLGRARDVLAQVVEKGLHLPEAARVLRSGADDRSWPTPPPPLPTVTLAEIYAAQGHLERAIAVLDEVLTREPEHAEAHGLRSRFVEQSRARSRRGPDVKIESTPPVIFAVSTPAPAKPEEPKPPAPAPELPPQQPAQPEIHYPVVEKPEPPKPEISPPSPSPQPEIHTPTTSRSAEVAPAATGVIAAMAVVEDEPALATNLDADLEEAALPERYDVDEIVALAVDPFTLYFYWEVRATSLARAQARRPGGWLAVRIAGVTASWSGPVTRVRDLRVDSLHGDRFLRDIDPGSNIRVSVGWQSGEEFEPFAVGLDVAAPHLRASDVVAGEVEAWRADAVGPGAALHMPPFNRLHLEGHRHAASGGGAVTSTRRRPAAAPTDTGVASWTDNAGGILRDGVARRGNMGVEISGGMWMIPGGGSELGRSGGASELSLR
ncbi:MAG: DUF4912 domain-containing protein [Byssovorax sp.]